MSLASSSMVEMARFPSFQRFVVELIEHGFMSPNMIGIIRLMRPEMTPYFPTLMAFFDALITGNNSAVPGLGRLIYIELTNYPVTREFFFSQN